MCILEMRMRSAHSEVLKISQTFNLADKRSTIMLKNCKSLVKNEFKIFHTKICKAWNLRYFPVIVFILVGVTLLKYDTTLSQYFMKKERIVKTWQIRISSDDEALHRGDSLKQSENGKIPDDIVNSNHYAPTPGEGKLGQAVHLTQRELLYSRTVDSLHNFNIIASDKMSINRTLPDVRSEHCRKFFNPVNYLVSASVIIVFHNEAWSTLMRTVMSIIIRSPYSLLKEIILVDDASERKYLGKELDDAIEKLPLVRVLRNSTRSGLVGARLIGAANATGEVIIFLDSHCEVTIGWLEPLLNRAGKHDVIVCPHIDVIQDTDMAYLKSIDQHQGGFNWVLDYIWLENMDNSTEYLYKPYPTPIMAGGLFAVRRSLFWRLGGYDKGMLVWGGENLELSWRAWQCGARVEIAPCSRVGHIFRKTTPHNYPGGISYVINTNKARAALVWMDEWSRFFFHFNLEAAELRDQQLVSDRIALRKSLQCKSFKWYLNNIWPDHFLPTEERMFGRIRNRKGVCLDPVELNNVGKCGNDRDLSKLLVITPGGKIMSHSGLCLEVNNGKVVWRSCTNFGWKLNWPRLRTNNDLCLDLVGADQSHPLKVVNCENKTEQLWLHEPVPWK